MNLRGLFLAALASLAVVDAEVVFIGHDKVQPFAQLTPTTDSEKTAIKFKPQLHISDGCHPYPAVDSKGSISGGLAWSGWPSSGCEGSDLGSQVYSRSDWYKGKWAIMYVWYFPKGRGPAKKFQKTGHRHFWAKGIVWVSSPSPDNSTILGVSVDSVYYKEKIPLKSKYVIDGTTVKLAWRVPFIEDTQVIRLTTRTGGTQDLITWEQLTKEARDALLEANFNVDDALSGSMPLGDQYFKEMLEFWHDISAIPSAA